MVPSVILFISAMIWVLFGMEIKIDYSNNNLNGTTALYNAQTLIEARTVPTVINGIATVTSIIIGFSGTTIGLLIKSFLQKVSKEREAYYLLSFAFPFAGSLALLYLAYTSLLMGGQGFLESSLRNALAAMVLALSNLLFIILIFSYVNDYKKPEKNTETGKTMVKPVEELRESEQEQLKREFQDRTL